MLNYIHFKFFNLEFLKLRYGKSWKSHGISFQKVCVNPDLLFWMHNWNRTVLRMQEYIETLWCKVCQQHTHHCSDGHHHCILSNTDTVHTQMCLCTTRCRKDLSVCTLIDCFDSSVPSIVVSTCRNFIRPR